METKDQQIAFEEAMVAAGYHQPEHSPFGAGDAYKYQRDQDRFAGWLLGSETFTHMLEVARCAGFESITAAIVAAGKAREAAQGPVAEWQVRCMSDPRQPGSWKRALEPKYAKQVFETFPNHTDEKGWEYRPLYPVAAQSAGQEPVAAALRWAANIVQLFDDATMCDDYMIDATQAEGILHALADFTERHAAPVNGGERDAIEAEQRVRMNERLANRKPTPATADFDLPAPNDGIAEQTPCYQCKGCGDSEYGAWRCVRCDGTGFERAADAQQVGGDADRIKAIPTAIMRTQDGRYVRMAAGADELIRRSDALAALTSPAKVGGDEREGLKGWRFEYRSDGDMWIVTTPVGEKWTAFGKTPAAELVQAARAALSADGKAEPEHTAIYLSKRLVGHDGEAAFIQAHINQAVSEAVEALSADGGKDRRDALELLRKLKRSLMHARRFGDDTLAAYRRACSDAECEIEEWLEAIDAAIAAEHEGRQ